MFKKLLTILFTVLISVSLITFNVHAESAPATPSAPKVENYVSGVRITVNKVEGASKYRIYRKEVLADGSISSYELVKTITGTTYIDKTVKSGTKYYYAVKAGNAENKYSKVSSKTPVFYLETPVLEVSTICNSEYFGDIKGMNIYIKTYSNASRFNLYRKGPNDKDYKLIKTITSKDNDGWTNYTSSGGMLECYYTDKNVKPDAKYAYKVEAQRGNYKSYVSKAVVNYYVPEVFNFMHSAAKGKVTLYVTDENGKGIDKMPKGVTGVTIFYTEDLSNWEWETYENSFTTSLTKKTFNLESGKTYRCFIRPYKKVGTTYYYNNPMYGDSFYITIQ